MDRFERLRLSAVVLKACFFAAAFLLGGLPLLILVAGISILAAYFLRRDLVRTRSQSIAGAIVAWLVWLIGVRYGLSLVMDGFPPLIRVFFMTSPSLIVLALMRHQPLPSGKSRQSFSPGDLVVGVVVALSLTLKAIATNTFRAIAMSGDSRNHALLADTYMQDGNYLLRSRYPGFVNVLMGYLTPFGSNHSIRPLRMRHLIDVLPVAFICGALMIGIGCVVLAETIASRLQVEDRKSVQVALWISPLFVLAPVFLYPILIDGFLTVGVAAGLLAIAMAFAVQRDLPLLWLAGTAACGLLVGIFPPIVPPLIIVLIATTISEILRGPKRRSLVAIQLVVLSLITVTMALSWSVLRSNLVLTGSIQRIPTTLIGAIVVLAIVPMLSKQRLPLVSVASTFILLSGVVWLEVQYIRRIASVSPNGDAYYASKLTLVMTGGSVALYLLPALLVAARSHRQGVGIERRIFRMVAVGVVAISGFIVLNIQATVPSAYPAIKNGWFRPRADSVALIRSELERGGRFIFWRFSTVAEDQTVFDVSEDRLANFWSALTWSGPKSEDHWAWNWAYGGINTLDPSELCGMIEQYSGVRVITRDNQLGGAIGDACGPNDDTLIVMR
jgi:hypothetical protein